ncbi:YdcF family protein [Wenzhouxiangella sp. AB-CW3]|uniref:YdcF family protein n=1 Tax=Wenzhouxiangella sp. AB-CW3 TaxID=2771012 RepID=UPI00168B5608|nr:YdcF family protein [Wenzhouxiangella sp. AB-CW3]QOC22021.1 YdcF family protein [Wenzhouxiangella sp. AB-CW3]
MTWYSPLIPLLVGMALLAVSAFMSRPRLAIIGLLLALPGYVLMTPLGANLLVLTIEHRTKAAETAPVCDQVQAAVLLSGGLNRPAETTSDFGALSPETLARIFAWRNRDLTTDAPIRPLTIAGGGPFRIPEAEVIGSFLRLIDPDEPPLQLEIASANTWESAKAVRKLLPESTSRILLASSALHLPRASFAFEQAGFEVCPLALNRHYLAVTGWTTLLPQSSSLAKSESALHEILGELSYRINPPDTPVTVPHSREQGHDQESSKKSRRLVIQQLHSASFHLAGD